MRPPAPSLRRSSAAGRSRQAGWLRLPFAGTMALALMFAAAGNPAASPRPAGAVPGGCSFYIVIDAASHPQALPAVAQLLPALASALQRLTEAGILDPADKPTSLMLAGFLQQDTVYLSVVVGGRFDEADFRKRLGDRLELVSASPAPTVYRTTAAGQPPIGLLFPPSGGLAAGRPETLRSIFHSPRAAAAPPESLQKALAGESFVTLYADQEVLSRLFSPGASGEGFNTLRQIFGRISDFAWTVESPLDGRCHIRMRCLRGEDASELAALLRNYLGLALLTAGQEEAQAAAILKTFAVDAHDREVDVRFSIPPPVLERLFATLFTF